MSGPRPGGPGIDGAAWLDMGSHGLVKLGDVAVTIPAGVHEVELIAVGADSGKWVRSVVPVTPGDIIDARIGRAP